MEYEVKDFISDLGITMQEVNFTSLDLFLRSVFADRKTIAFAKKCDKVAKNIKNGDNLKSCNNFLNDYLNDFISVQKLNNRQRRLTALITEYYIKGFTTQIILPYLQQEADSKIANVETNLKLSTNRLKHLESKQLEYSVKEEKLKYEEMMQLYSHDWETDFERIKLITDMLHSNETFENILSI